jgi:hypothetical protein
MRTPVGMVLWAAVVLGVVGLSGGRAEAQSVTASASKVPAPGGMPGFVVTVAGNYTTSNLGMGIWQIAFEYGSYNANNAFQRNNNIAIGTAGSITPTATAKPYPNQTASVPADANGNATASVVRVTLRFTPMGQTTQQVISAVEQTF